MVGYAAEDGIGAPCGSCGVNVRCGMWYVDIHEYCSGVMGLCSVMYSVAVSWNSVCTTCVVWQSDATALSVKCIR